MTLLLLQQIDPLSPDYLLPKATSTKELVRLLLARQKKIFGETITEVQPEFTERILQRNFKLLLDKYSLELVLRGLELSVLLGDYPGSTKIVEDMILYYVSLKTL